MATASLNEHGTTRDNPGQKTLVPRGTGTGTYVSTCPTSGTAPLSRDVCPTSVCPTSTDKPTTAPPTKHLAYYKAIIEVNLDVNLMAVCRMSSLGLQVSLSGKSDGMRVLSVEETTKEGENVAPKKRRVLPGALDT